MLPVWFDKAVEIYNEGKSYKKIGEILNVNRKQIGYYLKNNGYLPRETFANMNGVERKYSVWSKYSFNENFFGVIDTEEKAYWLGFLYADGYVSEKKSNIELGLKEGDIGHLEKFKTSLNSNHNFTRHKRILKGKEFIGYRITLNSKILKADLIAKGCVVRKSLIITFPTYDIVPKEFVRHFIRGCIDGDGCIYKKNGGLCIEMCGTIEFLDKYMEEINLHKNNIHLMHKERINSNAFKVSYSGPYAIHIINYIYKDATVYLDRKYELAKTVLPS